MHIQCRVGKPRPGPPGIERVVWGLTETLPWRAGVEPESAVGGQAGSRTPRFRLQGVAAFSRTSPWPTGVNPPAAHGFRTGPARSTRHPTRTSGDDGNRTRACAVRLRRVPSALHPRGAGRSGFPPATSYRIVPGLHVLSWPPAADIRRSGPGGNRTLTTGMPFQCSPIELQAHGATSRNRTEHHTIDSRAALPNAHGDKHQIRRCHGPGHDSGSMTAAEVATLRIRYSWIPRYCFQGAGTSRRGTTTAGLGTPTGSTGFLRSRILACSGVLPPFFESLELVFDLFPSSRCLQSMAVGTQEVTFIYFSLDLGFCIALSIPNHRRHIH